MQTDANWGTLNSGAERRGDGAAIRSTGYNVGSKGGVLLFSAVEVQHRRPIQCWLKGRSAERLRQLAAKRLVAAGRQTRRRQPQNASSLPDAKHTRRGPRRKTPSLARTLNASLPEGAKRVAAGGRKTPVARPHAKRTRCPGRKTPRPRLGQALNVVLGVQPLRRSGVGER